MRQALAQRDVAADELEQQKRALVRNTRNAYQTLVAGISEVEARRLALVSARSAYDASQVGLEVGTRTVLDVLNNQQNLFNAEREFALARYNFLQNRLLLEQAAGTLDIADVQDINRLLTVDAEAQLAPGDVTRSKPSRRVRPVSRARVVTASALHSRLGLPPAGPRRSPPACAAACRGPVRPARAQPPPSARARRHPPAGPRCASPTACASAPMRKRAGLLELRRRCR